MAIFLGIVLMGLSFLLMSIRLLWIKNGKFRGTCASQNPFFHKKGTTCSYCGKETGTCKEK